MNELRDSVMGIATRRRWFLLLREKLREAIPSFDEWDTISLQELVERIRAVAFSSEMHVIYGDVAFLSMVNRKGHSFGDEFLRKIGVILRKIEVYLLVLSGRLGGDEMAIFLVGFPDDTREEVLKKRDAIIDSVGQSASEIIIPMCFHTFQGHIDFGTVRFDEALIVFLRYVEWIIETSRGDLLPTGNRMSTLENILISIADRRSELEKIWNRVFLLVELFVENPEGYSESVNLVRKGSRDISDKEIARLADLYREGREEELQAWVSEWTFRPREVETELQLLIEEQARNLVA